MKVVSVFFISFWLLIISKQAPLKKTKSVPILRTEISHWDKNVQGFYLATQTGLKKAVPRPLKQQFKALGLLHLMTPSGIHLSSLLLFLFILIKGKKRLIIYSIAALAIFPLMGFYSLKRIILFHLIKPFTKSNEISFILTFLIDMLVGGYQNSPLSFAYSFLCWGCIIFSKEKLEVITNLFIAQIYISYFNQDQMNALSLVINPALTGIFSFAFPIMSLNFWIFKLNFLFDWIFLFLDYFLGIILFLNQKIDFLLFTPSFLFLLAPLVKFTKKPVLLGLFAYLASSNLNLIKQKPQGKEFTQASYSHSRELLRSSKNRLDFVDRACIKKFKESFWTIKCKKKALHLGGPVI